MRKRVKTSFILWKLKDLKDCKFYGLKWRWESNSLPWELKNKKRMNMKGMKKRVKANWILWKLKDSIIWDV